MNSDPHTKTPKLGEIERPQDMPLSFAQQRLWFLDGFLRDKAIYNIPFAWRLKGSVKPQAVGDSLQKIVERHEALRTHFELRGDEPVQIIRETLDPILTTIRLEHLPEEEAEKEAVKQAEQEAVTPFDLATGPVIRAKLFCLSKEDYLLLLNVHHIASDGWSSGVIQQELSVIYNAEIDGRDPSLPPLAVQYSDYAIWQRAWLQGPVLENQIAYWKQQLSNLATLELPSDFPRPAISTNRGLGFETKIPNRLKKAIEKIGLKAGSTTLFMTLLAAFKVLLYRYSGQDDIVIGTPIAGRQDSQLEGMIGFFVNTLVLRDDLSGNPTFIELVKRVRNTALDALSNPDIPFEKLVEELSPDRDLSRNPLFQVMFVLQNTPSSELNFKGIEPTRFPIARPSAKFDLELSLTEAEDHLRVSWELSSDLFEKATIERMSQHYINLLESIVSDPDAEIGSLSLIDKDERRQLLEHLNGAVSYEFGEVGVHTLFERQVTRAPQAEAVSYSDYSLSYEELNNQANRLSQYLISKGVTLGTGVGVCLERSANLIVSLLAVLKAGGVYIPLDPAYPAERLTYMLEDAEASFVISERSLTDKLKDYRGYIICTDVDQDAVESMTADQPETHISTHTPAYVIYTSGSTGTPKGMALPHATLVNLLLNEASHPPGRRVAQFTSISFDVSLQEIFFALTKGHTLVIIDGETRIQPSAFAQFLNDEQIADLFVPNTVLQYVLQAANDTDLPLPQLTNIYQAGEPLSVTPTVRAFFKAHPNCRLHNNYGPAESHVVTTHLLSGLVDHWQEKPAIGCPIPNTRIYLLDQNQNLQPQGIPGEIYIAGVGLASGYINLPELSEQKFLKDPFTEGSNAIMYRTGDLGRYRTDGSIEFLGRADDQIKIRGFRIEPGEIESLLVSYKDIKQAAVLPREDSPGETRLVAYLVTHNTEVTDHQLLCSWLKERLPDYMIPSAFVSMDSFPLTTNGKLDRRALPEPDYNKLVTDHDIKEPLSEIEAVIAEVCREILNLDHVGKNDNLFVLGAHSLSAFRINGRVSDKCKVSLSIRSFFEKPTVAELAIEVEKLLQNS